MPNVGEVLRNITLGAIIAMPGGISADQLRKPDASSVLPEGSHVLQTNIVFPRLDLRNPVIGVFVAEASPIASPVASPLVSPEPGTSPAPETGQNLEDCSPQDGTQIETGTAVEASPSPAPTDVLTAGDGTETAAAGDPNCVPEPLTQTDLNDIMKKIMKQPDKFDKEHPELGGIQSVSIEELRDMILGDEKEGKIGFWEKYQEHLDNYNPPYYELSGIKLSLNLVKDYLKNLEKGDRDRFSKESLWISRALGGSALFFLFGFIAQDAVTQEEREDAIVIMDMVYDNAARNADPDRPKRGRAQMDANIKIGSKLLTH